MLQARNPESEDPVWATPRSLAATQGISIDFCSSGYLDVSVRRVGLIFLLISENNSGGSLQRVLSFGNLRVIALIQQLPEAYRSLIRPSSPSGAKASTN